MLTGASIANASYGCHYGSCYCFTVLQPNFECNNKHGLVFSTEDNVTTHFPTYTTLPLRIRKQTAASFTTRGSQPCRRVPCEWM